MESQHGIINAMKKRKFSLLVLLVLIIANAHFWTNHSWARRSSPFDQLAFLADLRHEIVEGYVTEPDQKKLVESAARGMVDALGDPYTNYLSDDELQQFDKNMRGSFSGIGAEVMIDDELDRLKIVTPLEESPAWNSGVLAGDIVLEITDGEETKDTAGMSLNECVDMLIGPEGTQVTIKVRHESGDIEKITITRARINIQTVKGFQRDKEHHWDWMMDHENKIGYIRMSQFSENTSDAMEEALTSLEKDGAKAVILDLRSNPGGLLDAAVRISDMFLEEGQTIVSVKGRRVREQSEKATARGTVFSGEVVVIVNEASASASEIVSGALKDNDRAQIVGTRTFGKGSVQQLRPLEDGMGALKLTNAYYYIPSGRKIHRVKDAEKWGVDPHDGSYVAMTPKQISEMFKIRREGDILRHDGDQEQKKVTIELIRDELKDLQLAAALEAARGKVATGEWPKVGKDNTDTQVILSRRENLMRQQELIDERLRDIDKEIKFLDAKVAGDIPMDAKIDDVKLTDGVIKLVPAEEGKADKAAESETEEKAAE